MRILKTLVVVTAAIVATGCACRTRQVGGENIAAVEPGKELADVHFAFDSYALDSAAQATLRRNAEWLNANPGRSFQIEGHTDERGTNEYNKALGMKRAQAAKDFLRSLGVDANRMSTVSYGEELPLDPRSNEEAWAKNRRGHFALQ